MSAVPSQSVQFGCPHCGCELTIPAHAGPLEGPCPRCEKPIRAAAPSAKAPTNPPSQQPAASLQPSAGTFHSVKSSNHAQVPLTPPVNTAASQPQALHCQCPNCGHHHAFAAKHLGEVTQCSGCQTAIRLPQKPLPEVPLRQEAPAQKKEPLQLPVLKPAQEQASGPVPVQSTLDSVVKTLHEYEQAGVPSDHPDRLHLLEQFFTAFSAGELNKGAKAQAPTPAVDSIDALSGPIEFQGPSARSHIPPRRDGVRPEIQPRIIPPVGRTARPAIAPPSADNSSESENPAAASFSGTRSSRRYATEGSADGEHSATEMPSPSYP